MTGRDVDVDAGEHEQDEAEAAVLFSGGADSSLAALELGEREPARPRRVHLIQFEHRFHSFPAKSLRSVELLEERLGRERVVHRLLDMGHLFERLYLARLPELIRSHGTLPVSVMCGACKLCMHLLAIRYCRSHGVGITCDGASHHQAYLFPSQTPPILEYYREVYARYGIRYVNPVFDVERSEAALAERGFDHWRTRKKEHLFYSSQPSCYLGLVTYLYVYGFQLPLVGELGRRRSLDVEAVPFLREIENQALTMLGMSRGNDARGGEQEPAHGRG